MHTIIKGKKFALKKSNHNGIERLKIVNPPMLKYARKAFFDLGIGYWFTINSYGEAITPFNFPVYVDGKKINKN